MKNDTNGDEDDDDDCCNVNAMTDDSKREEGATFFTRWLCFSNILAFIKTINHTYSGSSLASSQSFPSSNRMCPPHFFLHII